MSSSSVMFQKILMLLGSVFVLAVPCVSCAGGGQAEPGSLRKYADGRIDSTKAIQSLVDAASRGSGLVNLPGGDYLIDANQGIYLSNGTRLVLDPSTRLIASPQRNGNYGIIKIFGVHDASVSGGAIVGERHRHLGKDGEWGMGIDIKGSSSIRISNITISNCWGDGVYIGGWKGVPSTDVTLDNVSSLGNRRQGLSITSGHRILVANSRFIGTSGTAPQAGIDLEPNKGESVSNVTIRNCVASNNAGPGIMTLNCASNVRITGCKIQQNASSEIYLGGIVNAVHVSGNLISGNRKEDVVVGSTVTDFKIENNTHAYGVK